MTKEELNSFDQFKDLPHYDGNDLSGSTPIPEEHSINSAMTVSEANLWFEKGGTPKYVEYHTSDEGEVGYEVIFWIPR